MFFKLSQPLYNLKPKTHLINIILVNYKEPALKSNSHIIQLIYHYWMQFKPFISHSVDTEYFMVSKILLYVTDFSCMFSHTELLLLLNLNIRCFSG